MEREYILKAGETPAYAFVPGHWPHPERSPDGHSYGKMPLAICADRPESWLKRKEWWLAVALFDAGYYWEAHEVWEAFWVASPRGEDHRSLLGGLIQVAAAAVKARQTHEEQGSRLLLRALSKWDTISTSAVLGWEIAKLRSYCDRARDEILEGTFDPKSRVQRVYSGLLARCLTDEASSSSDT